MCKGWLRGDCGSYSNQQFAPHALLIKRYDKRGKWVYLHQFWTLTILAVLWVLAVAVEGGDGD